ncbi:MAG: hypothetical protein FWC32_00590, partial [Firmicutes bacterium]|nr:hypothetical protein [Bacillota bacterium]
AGNTDAVPLYKKCGFLWEERPDSTYLINFIPSIVKTPLFAEFFAKADWYADSTRSLEITPDGEKVNEFKLLSYAWEKDGDTLAITYERTGKQIQMIETLDYKISLMAQDHVLASGTNYNCGFTVENKSGKPLDVKINGMEDRNIHFDLCVSATVTDTQEFPGEFYLGELGEVQDSWKIHPCVLADVEINGQTVTFGLGIETKFPLAVNLRRDCLVDQLGMNVKAHINMESALTEDAEFTVRIPKSELLSFVEGSTFTAKVPAKGKMSINTIATTLAIGFENLVLDCTATLKNGRSFNFTAKFDIYTRDMVSAFGGETLTDYHAFNGPWAIHHTKMDTNEVYISHLIRGDYSGYAGFEGMFVPPKFGKPFDDEFNLMKPNVKIYPQGNGIVMEEEYVSEKFPGMVATQILTLYGTGIITAVSRIENRGSKPTSLMYQTRHLIGLSGKSIFSYKGQINQNLDTVNASNTVGMELSGIDLDGFDENWVFEANSTSTRGLCWPMEYKPEIIYDAWFYFDFELGELAPGAVFETKPIVHALGLFPNYNDFRNYARQIYETATTVPSQPIDIALNGFNPFVTASDVKLEVRNNREYVISGDVTVTSQGLFETQTQTNPDEDPVKCNTFDLPLSPSGPVDFATVTLSTSAFERTYNRAVFFPKGEVTCTQDGTNYIVSNGAIKFKVDPVYGNVCYSLTDDKNQEWLMSKYPNHEPYSWFNPFLGGINANIPGMNAASILKEKISAQFTEVRDNMGGLWQGVCVTVEVTEFEGMKGGIYKTYFLTQPGLPLLCGYYEFLNNTGESKKSMTNIGGMFSPDDNPKNVFLDTVDKARREYRLRLGTEDFDEFNFENIAVLSGSRREKMYVFHGNKYNNKLNYAWANNDVHARAGAEMMLEAADGETFTSSPLFILLTDKELPFDSLDDLERIKFM